MAIYSAERDGVDLRIRNTDGSYVRLYYSGAGLWFNSAGHENPEPEPGIFRFPFPRSQHSTYPGHSGADWGKPRGTNIRAVGGGTVISVTSGFDNSGSESSAEPMWRGNSVVIDHGDIDGHRIWSLYAHMETTPLVAVDDVVTGGQIIGKVGNSGFSRGFHLHFEIIFDGIRLQTGEGGYERTIGWMDSHATGSW